MAYLINLIIKRTNIKQAERGFTIIEISIVLAVSGFLIIYAINSVFGKPANGRFHTSTSDFQTSMEQIINQTTNGQYTGGNYTCIPVNGGGAPPNVSSGSGTQGANSGCIFLGNVIQFNPNVSGKSNTAQYSVYPVAGNQYDGTSPSETIAQAYPIMITVSNTSQTLSVENGLKVVSVYAQTSSTGSHISTTAIGILSGDSVGNLYTSNASGSLNSGSEPSSLYYDSNSPGSQYTTGVGITAGTLNSDVTNLSHFAYAAQVTICIANNTQSASLQIGENGGLNDTLRVFKDTTCL